MPASRPITGIDTTTGAPYSALAWGDGTNDDTAVLQAALNACGLIKVPSGIYKVSSTLTIPYIDGAGIIGDGAALPNANLSAGTVFMSNQTTGDIIACPQSLMHATFRGFVLDRSVSPVSGYGLNMSIIGDAGCVDDVWSKHSGIGFYFGTTGYANVSNCRAEANLHHGFEIVGQWQLSNLSALLNGGDGFFVQGIIPNGNSMGQWRGLATYGNGGNGIGFYGATLPVHGIRLSDSFLGGDGGYAVYDDSHSSVPNVYTNVYVEAEPLDGFHFTANAGQVSLNNCVAISNTGSGLKSYAALCLINGGAFQGNQGYGTWHVQNQGSVIGADVTANVTGGIAASVGVNGFSLIGNRVNGNTGLNVDTSVASGVYAAGNY